MTTTTTTPQTNLTLQNQIQTPTISRIIPKTLTTKCPKSYMDINDEAIMMIEALLATSSKAWLARLMCYSSNCGSQQVNKMLNGGQTRMKICSYRNLKKQYEDEILDGRIQRPKADCWCEWPTITNACSVRNPPPTKVSISIFPTMLRGGTTPPFFVINANPDPTSHGIGFLWIVRIAIIMAKPQACVGIVGMAISSKNL